MRKGVQSKYAHIRMGVFRFFSLPLLWIWKLAKLPTESNHPLIQSHKTLSSFWAWTFYLDYQIFYTAINFPNLPKRDNKMIHIFDRYIYDALVDLSIAKGNVMSLTNLSTRTFFKIFPKPSITILLDVNPKIAMDRKGDSEIHDLSYLSKRRIIYLELAKKFGFQIINANNNFNIVHNEILIKLKTVGLKIIE
jgi:thymidylate kinase|tara:strand:- start:616 stop:1194 length:579 start_codon:yes stop_codon:yes gene_type:complete